MKLTKDECRILSACVEIAKFELKLPPGGFDVLEGLEKKLEERGQDERRKGRTTANTFSDLLERYTREKSLV